MAQTPPFNFADFSCPCSPMRLDSSASTTLPPSDRTTAANAFLWTGFKDELGDGYLALRKTMSSGLFAESSAIVKGGEGVAGYSGGEGYAQQSSWMAEAILSGAGQNSDVSAASLWARHQQERQTLLSKYTGAADCSGAQLDRVELSKRQAEWSALFLQQIQEVEALVQSASSGLTTSVHTIVPPPSSSFSGSASDDILWEMDEDLALVAHPCASPPAASNAFATEHAILDSPGLLWGSPETLSGSSWTSRFEADLDLKPCIASSTGLRTSSLSAPDNSLPWTSPSLSVSQGKSAPITHASPSPSTATDRRAIVATLEMQTPAGSVVGASRPMRRTSSGAKFERSKFSCDTCLRRRKKCTPHPRADGSIPQLGDCEDCVKEAKKRNLKHVDCSYAIRAVNVDRARASGALKEAFHHVML